MIPRRSASYNYLLIYQCNLLTRYNTKNIILSLRSFLSWLTSYCWMNAFCFVIKCQWYYIKLHIKSLRERNSFKNFKVNFKLKVKTKKFHFFGCCSLKIIMISWAWMTFRMKMTDHFINWKAWHYGKTRCEMWLLVVWVFSYCKYLNQTYQNKLSF